MNQLFIYGTLLDKNVQQEVLGKSQDGKWGLVDNYILRRDWAVEGKAYPRLFPHSDGCVTGQIIEVTDEELILLDEYETDAYYRDKVHVKDFGKVDTYFAIKKVP